MHFQYASVLMMFVLGIGLCALMLGLGALLRPSNPHPGKLATYECGEPPSVPAWINFNIRFYLIALVFVIFDVELAFIYPVAAVLRDWVITRGQGLLALVALAVFVGRPGVGLAHVWREGDLQWRRRVPRRTASPGGVREAA